MIFYRSSKPSDLSLGALRALSLAALASYPAGAMILALSDKQFSVVVGYGLILLSLICAMVIFGSALQRIVGEQPQKLDEYDLKLRARAMNGAYTGLSVLALVTIIYFAIGTDKGLWVPDSYEDFNGLFWGAFLYASVLPTAFLVWQLDSSYVQSEG